MTQGISYPPHIKPFVDAYKSAVAGILGWRLVGDGTLQDIQARFQDWTLLVSPRWCWQVVEVSTAGLYRYSFPSRIQYGL